VDEDMLLRVTDSIYKSTHPASKKRSLFNFLESTLSGTREEIGSKAQEYIEGGDLELPILEEIHEAVGSIILTKTIQMMPNDPTEALTTVASTLHSMLYREVNVKDPIRPVEKKAKKKKDKEEADEAEEDEDEIEVIMNKLRVDCTRTGAPKAAVPRVMQTVQDYVEVTKDMASAVEINCNRLTMQKALLRGAYIQTGLNQGMDIKEIAKGIKCGAKDPERSSAWTIPLRIYNLVTNLMYRLRFAQFTKTECSKKMKQLVERYDAICEFLQENPDEAKWWMDKQEKPKMVHLEGGVLCVAHEWLMQ
jgi:hypothetical protein